MKKKRKLGRKLLSFLLTLAMLVGLMPGMSLTAYAADVPYANLKDTINVINFDGKEWYLIDYDGDSTVTLLSKECVGASVFNPNEPDVNTYSGSAVENFVNSWYTRNISPDAQAAVSGSGMFLLTEEQAGNLSTDVLKCSPASGAHDNHWWLCSKGTTDSSAAMVNGGSGNVSGYSGNVWIAYGVRPALKLDLSKVMFDSDTNTFNIKVDVTGVTLNKTAVTLNVNGTETLTATVAPDDDVDKTVIWSSDNTAVATVSDGVVTAVAEGIANITVTATNGTDVTSDDKTATCAVTVEPISYNVTYKVVNGTWDGTSTADKTETVASGRNPAGVPTGMKANSGYTGGSWDTDPSTATISADTTFTYTFVAKEAATVIKAPTANTLTYNGKPQELVTAGKAEGGEMQYALGTKDAATEEYTTSIPTATDAGTYYVWYKASGNSDYEESEPGCVEVTIREDEQPDNDEGNINVKTITEEGAPDCGLEVPDDTLDSLLTEEEKERLNNGKAVLFYLDVSPTDPSETDKSLIESKLKEISSDAQVGMFFDMSFYKQVGDSDPEKITDLNGKKVNVLIDVPKELQNAESGKTRIFYVVRIHNGVAEIIAESTKTPIPVESDKFSTYAILYEDVEKSTGSSYEHHHHICEHGHIFNYHVFQEPTTETDGYAGWVCDRCGIQDPDHADYVGPTGYIVLSAFPVFNDTLEKNIAAAPENGTVSISTKRWMSVRRGVLEALAARPDVTLSISFAYENEDYVLTIKGSDPNLAGFTASGDLFYGFIYLGNGFGLEKKTAEVPQS